MKKYRNTCPRYSSSAWIILTLILCASVWGCVNSKYLFTGPEDTEKALRERISKVWKAKIDGDCATIYDFACANYRKNITKDQHMTRPCKGRFDNFNIVNIELKPDGTSARATIQFDTESQGFLIKGAQIKETWIKENGEWVLELPLKEKSPFDS